MSIEDRLAKKLYDPRTIEGSPDNDTFEAIKALEDAFQDRPEFIGLDPFGSTVKGYATVGSDIDISVLVDVGFDDIVENIYDVSSITHAFEMKARKVEDAIKTKNGREVHTLVFIVNKNENNKRIQHLLSDEHDALIVGSLFRKIKGPKIDEYRNSAIEEILKLSELEQRRVVRRMADALTEKELLNLRKIEERSGEEINRLTIREQRTTMWEKHIWSLIKKEI